MRKLFNCKNISLVYLVILVSLWGSVLLIGGQIGPYAWWGLMVFGCVGILTGLICIIKIILKFFKKQKNLMHSIMLLCISLVISWPSFWFFGIGQIAYPVAVDSVEPIVSIRSPFEEPVIVAWGGNTLKDNYHVWLPAERWAYDLFAIPAVVESQNLEDYGIYGMDIVAPISGYVVGMYEQEMDHGTGMSEFESTFGNYVFIKIEETGSYIVLGHLKCNSIQVEMGDYINEGMVIAQVGNTGMSSEPHLHLHHQKQDPNETLLLAEGLPLFFRDIEESSMPRGGGDRLINGVRVPVGETITPIH